MKYLAAIVALIVWGAITLALVVSILGIVALMFMNEPTEDGKQGWFDIPFKLVKVFE
jgi:hypothetical protein